MKKYAEYSYQYKNVEIKYFICDITFFPNKTHRIARMKLQKDGKTIKRFELTLNDNDKLNKECETALIKYVIDWYECHKGELL